MSQFVIKLCDTDRTAPGGLRTLPLPPTEAVRRNLPYNSAVNGSDYEAVRLAMKRSPQLCTVLAAMTS